jgi:hypothetical protein
MHRKGEAPAARGTTLQRLGIEVARPLAVSLMPPQLAASARLEINPPLTGAHHPTKLVPEFFSVHHRHDIFPEYIFERDQHDASRRCMSFRGEVKTRRDAFVGKSLRLFTVTGRITSKRAPASHHENSFLLTHSTRDQVHHKLSRYWYYHLKSC